MSRMLVIVAHPDDETFGTGSVIAAAAAGGADVVVCCATRGEAGVDTSGTTSSPAELAEVREGELRAAAKVLGASEVVLLDFPDSGMTGEMPPNALAGAPIGDVVRALTPVIERVQPDVVVGFDFEGLRDHRDHVHIGEAATLAFDAAAPSGATLYHWTLARSMMDRWVGEMRDLGQLDAYVEMQLGRTDDEITTSVAVDHVIATRRAAIAQHRTQMSPFTGVSSELERVILSHDHFVRRVPAWPGGEVETRLLGL